MGIEEAKMGEVCTTYDTYDKICAVSLVPRKEESSQGDLDVDGRIMWRLI
jgi:hypothetical protein